MAAVFIALCGECNKHHEFCLPDSGSIKLTRTYEYTCPNTANIAQVVPPNKWNGVEKICPPGSVNLKEV